MINRNRIPAVYMRGGTSKGLVFHRRDLPADRAEWDGIFLGAMGSPDPYGRQLDGMGGGTSTLSKVCIVEPASRDGFDVDYTFAQVSVKQAKVDYGSICGNMSAAVALFAQQEGLVPTGSQQTVVRIFNTNTKKALRATLDIGNGAPPVRGLMGIPGVAGEAPPVRLDFIDPSGATTGKLLPTGNARDTLRIPGYGSMAVSLIDAGTSCVFIDAGALGLEGSELPSEISTRAEVVALVEQARRHASVAMGLAPDIEAAAAKPVAPFVCVIAPAMDSGTLSGAAIAVHDVDFTVRAFANGQPHLALPITASLCCAVAAEVEGSLLDAILGANRQNTSSLRIGMPSGILNVAASLDKGGGRIRVHSASLYRTARRLFDGFVYA